MQRYIKVLFFALIVKPVVFLVIGLNIKNRNKLPKNGPAVISSNHNSHLDTMVIMSLYPLSILHKIRPVAAADYFMKNRVMAWFATNCIGIIPLDRTGATTLDELFVPCHKALNNGDILIIFPEGSRGKPEQLSKLKKGIFYLVKDTPNTPVVPVLLEGLGNVLPKGEALLVPFVCTIEIGDAITCHKSSKELLGEIGDFFQKEV